MTAQCTIQSAFASIHVIGSPSLVTFATVLTNSLIAIETSGLQISLFIKNQLLII
jgi:hypothetical protein